MSVSSVTNSCENRIRKHWLLSTACFLIFYPGLACVTSLCFLSGCGNSDRKDWDEGYESAWEGEEPPSSYWDSKAKKEGYEYGKADADAYDEGYYGKNGHGPKYTKDDFYMDGYKQGRKDKKY